MKELRVRKAFICYNDAVILSYRPKNSKNKHDKMLDHIGVDK